MNERADPTEVLELPTAARMRERLTKVMLVDAAVELGVDPKIIDRSFDLTTAVVGVIRPETAQVPAGRAGADVVGDIPVIHLVLTGNATSTDQTKLTDLIHRSMARPVILFVTSPKDGDWISLALTHISVNKVDRSVIDARVMVSLEQIAPGALRFKGLDRADLATLYRNLTRVAAANGRPTVPGLTAEQIIRMRNELTALEAELASTVRAARGERSQSGRIAQNSRAREIRDQINTVGAGLYSPLCTDIRTNHSNARKQDS